MVRSLIVVTFLVVAAVAMAEAVAAAAAADDVDAAATSQMMSALGCGQLDSSYGLGQAAMQFETETERELRYYMQGVQLVTCCGSQSSCRSVTYRLLLASDYNCCGEDSGNKF